MRHRGTESAELKTKIDFFPPCSLCLCGRISSSFAFVLRVLSVFAVAFSCFGPKADDARTTERKLGMGGGGVKKARNPNDETRIPSQCFMTKCPNDTRIC